MNQSRNLIQKLNAKAVLIKKKEKETKRKAGMKETDLKQTLIWTEGSGESAAKEGEHHDHRVNIMHEQVCE